MVQRKTTRARHGQDDDAIRRALIDGVACNCDADGHRLHVPSMDELREVWQKLGNELTAEFIKTHPGRRPWAWWTINPGKMPDGYGPWPLVVFGRVRMCSRSQLGGLVQRLHLQIRGELSNAELSKVNADEPLTNEECRQMWAHLHQHGEN